MDISDIIFLALGAVEAISGLASIFTHKVYLMGKSAGQYTEESLRKFSLPLGISNLLCGVGFILDSTLKAGLFKIGDYTVKAGIVALLACVVVGGIVWIAGKKVLVKK